jgi:hypothetical protein
MPAPVVGAGGVVWESAGSEKAKYVATRRTKAPFLRYRSRLIGDSLLILHQ